MQDFVNDPVVDLMAQIPHGEPGHIVLREGCNRQPAVSIGREISVVGWLSEAVDSP